MPPETTVEDADLRAGIASLDPPGGRRYSENRGYV